MKTLICDCNRTMPLDVQALGRALAKTPLASADGLQVAHSTLCRREAGAFQRAALETGQTGDELLVACTQEQRLFLELNEQTEGAASVQERPIRFVNLRETGAWGSEGREATPKLAALIAAAQLPDPEPVATVTYRSAGRVLVIGGTQVASRAAALLADKLEVSLLLDGPSGTLPQTHDHAVHHGRLESLTGWLGALQARWVQDQPIDLDVCTRCNACVQTCPEGAIGLDYRIDLDVCRAHRDCVRVCEAAGAIDFTREPLTMEERFDLVLDLREQPAFTQHQVPQGYLHVPLADGTSSATSDALMRAVLTLRELTGEFEKPRFFRYQQRLCAHSRNEQVGCTACIDVCSARAIRSDASRKGKTSARPSRHAALTARLQADGAPASAAAVPPNEGGGVIVEPYLCVGCGACSTVCPSGALSFTYPGPADRGRRLRTLLTAYAHAGGRNAALLIHSEGAGRRWVEALGRAASTARTGPGPARSDASRSTVRGLPARVLPVAVWHTASVGLDLWLSALAQGASQVWVLVTDEEAPDYRRALAEQMAVAQALLSGLGYTGQHLRLTEVTARGAEADSASTADTRGPAAVLSAASGGAAEVPPARALAALDAALRTEPAQTVVRPAAFAVQADKRATLDLALDHLMAQAPVKAEAIALPAAGAPFGSLVVDPARCTLCLSCVGACPEGALADNPERPQLKFIEKACVQCGLCATTCPEQAITLEPRLWLADGGKARKNARVLHEAEPWQCIRCSKPFGTLRAIESMIEKLSGHAAFQGQAAQRLKMCSDCRVIDLYSDPGEVKITDL